MGKVVADFQTPPSLTPPEGDVSFNSINNTPIGGVTPSSGAFTTLSASTSATLPEPTTVGGTNVSSALATRAPSQSLLFSGTQGRSTATLGVSTISGAREILVDMTVPGSAVATADGIVQVSPSGVYNDTGSLSVYFEAAMLRVELVANSSDKIVANVAGFITTYSGQSGTLAIVQPATGDLVIKWNGETLAYTESTGGTPPAWSDAITGPYIDIGTLGTSGYPASFPIGTVHVLNRVLTDAERSAYITHRALPADCYPSTPAGPLSGGTWSNYQYDTFSTSSQAGFVAEETGGQDCQANLSFSGGSTQAGNKIRVTLTATLTSGRVPTLNLGRSTVGAISATVPIIAGTHTYEFTTYLDTTPSEFLQVAVTTFGNYSYEISNTTVEILGAVFSPDADQPGYGSTWRDVSGWNADLAVASGVKWGRPASGDIPAGSISIPDGTLSIGDGTSATTITQNCDANVGDDKAVYSFSDGLGNPRAQLATGVQTGGDGYLDIKQRVGGVLTRTHRFDETGVLHVGTVSGAGALNVRSTSTATTVNTGALRTANMGHSGNLGGPTWFGGVVTHAGTFAGIHVHDSSTAQTVPTGATYTKITAFTDNDPANDCTADAANDKITITRAGIYKVGGSASFYSDTNNVTWKATVFLDGVEQDNVHWERKIGTGADLGNASFSGFVDVTTVPVDLDLRMRHDQAGDVALTITYSNLNVSFEGNT